MFSCKFAEYSEQLFLRTPLDGCFCLAHWPRGCTLVIITKGMPNDAKSCNQKKNPI